jgi:hypothetical protein
MIYAADRRRAPISGILTIVKANLTGAARASSERRCGAAIGTGPCFDSNSAIQHLVIVAVNMIGNSSAGNRDGGGGLEHRESDNPEREFGWDRPALSRTQI